MPEPHRPRKIEIFSGGGKVTEIVAKNNCNPLSASIGAQQSPDKHDCGKRVTCCPDGWSYYSGTYGACGPGCWKYDGGTQTTCGYKGWRYTRASQCPVLEHKWRHVVTVFENGENGFKEIGKWESAWFCYSNPTQIAAYDAAKPTTTSHNVEWCAPDRLLCGYPCWEEAPEEWCCLDCEKIEKQLKQLAEAAEKIKELYP